jgi:hypothetical protein
MWIEEHRFLNYRWYVARRWELSPVGYSRHSRYCKLDYVKGLEDGTYSLDGIEQTLFGSVIPTRK